MEVTPTPAEDPICPVCEVAETHWMSKQDQDGTENHEPSMCCDCSWETEMYESKAEAIDGMERYGVRLVVDDIDVEQGIIKCSVTRQNRSSPSSSVIFEEHRNWETPYMDDWDVVEKAKQVLRKEE